MPSSSLISIALILICVLGLIYCFRGYRYLRVFVTLYGLYAGYSWVMRYFGSYGEWMWIAALAAGILLGLLAFFFVKFAMFLTGGLMGLLIFYAISLVNPGLWGGAPSFLIGLVFFVIAGAVTVAAKKPLLIIGTAFYGAYTFTDAFGILLGVWAGARIPAGVGLSNLTGALDAVSIYRTWAPFLPWLITILLAIVGIIKQFQGPKRDRRARNETRS